MKIKMKIKEVDFNGEREINIRDGDLRQEIDE